VIEFMKEKHNFIAEYVAHRYVLNVNSPSYRPYHYKYRIHNCWQSSKKNAPSAKKRHTLETEEQNIVTSTTIGNRLNEDRVLSCSDTAHFQTPCDGHVDHSSKQQAGAALDRQTSHQPFVLDYSKPFSAEVILKRPASPKSWSPKTQNKKIKVMPGDDPEVQQRYSASSFPSLAKPKSSDDFGIFDPQNHFTLLTESTHSTAEPIMFEGLEIEHEFALHSTNAKSESPKGPG
jgi:hypothetical protein